MTSLTWISIYVRKTSNLQIKCFEYITCHKIMYLFCAVAPHWDWLSYQRHQLRISQNTNPWSPGTFSKVHINAKLIQSKRLGSLLPLWHPLMKPLKVPAACMFPVPVSCAIKSLLCSKDSFCCDSAKLKLTLGFCFFTRCLNVPWLRLRTSALRCPTVHCARQRRLYRALAVFDCRLVALVELGVAVVAVRLCCLLLAHCLLW